VVQSTPNRVARNTVCFRISIRFGLISGSMAAIRSRFRWPRETGYMSDAKRGRHASRRRWGSCWSPSGRFDLGRRAREDDVTFMRTSSAAASCVCSPCRPAELDDEVLAFDVPRSRKLARNASVEPPTAGAETQDADARSFRLLLCARNQRPRDQRRAGKPDHSRRLMVRFPSRVYQSPSPACHWSAQRLS